VESVLFGDIWVQEKKLRDVNDPVAKATDAKVRVLERLQVLHHKAT
jgi:hypothetical protein